MAKAARNAEKPPAASRTTLTSARVSDGWDAPRLSREIERGLRGLGTRERAEHEKRYRWGQMNRTLSPLHPCAA